MKSCFSFFFQCHGYEECHSSRSSFPWECVAKKALCWSRYSVQSRCRCRGTRTFFPASTVQLVALSEWFVYTRESSAAREMFFIMLAKVFMPTAWFGYHLSPSHFTFGRCQNASHCSFSLLIYSSRDLIGQRLAWAIIIGCCSSYDAPSEWTMPYPTLLHDTAANTLLL